MPARASKPDRRPPGLVLATLLGHLYQLPSREILIALARRPWGSGELAKRLGLADTTVSRHLQRLRREDLTSFKQCVHNRIFTLGPAAQATFANGILTLTVRGSAAVSVTLNLGAEVLAELEWGDGPKASPDIITTRSAGALYRRGSAGKPPRPSSGQAPG